MVQLLYRHGFWVQCGRGLQTKKVFLKMSDPLIKRDYPDCPGARSYS